jgi:tetratricopeptide (TPR) repeat protein
METLDGWVSSFDAGAFVQARAEAELALQQASAFEVPAGRNTALALWTVMVTRDALGEPGGVPHFTRRLALMGQQGTVNAADEEVYLGYALWREGDLPGARAAFQRALMQCEQADARPHLEDADSCLAMGNLLVAQGKPEEGAPYLQRAAALYARLEPEEFERTLSLCPHLPRPLAPGLLASRCAVLTR